MSKNSYIFFGDFNIAERGEVIRWAEMQNQMRPGVRYKIDVQKLAESFSISGLAFYEDQDKIPYDTPLGFTLTISSEYIQRQILKVFGEIG